jgi:hypothetical protein
MRCDASRLIEDGKRVRAVALLQLFRCETFNGGAMAHLLVVFGLVAVAARIEARNNVRAKALPPAGLSGESDPHGLPPAWCCFSSDCAKASARL